MSLDVYLIGPAQEVEETCYCCGHTKKMMRVEEYYTSNITHNLGKMAAGAGIYVHLWRPEELGITKAEQLIKPLEEGLADLKARPEFFKKLDAPNGWGKYEHLVSFVADYLQSCKAHPEAEISVSR